MKFRKLIVLCAKLWSYRQIQDLQCSSLETRLSLMDRGCIPKVKGNAWKPFTSRISAYEVLVLRSPVTCTRLQPSGSLCSDKCEAHAEQRHGESPAPGHSWALCTIPWHAMPYPAISWPTLPYSMPPDPTTYIAMTNMTSETISWQQKRHVMHIPYRKSAYLTVYDKHSTHHVHYTALTRHARSTHYTARRITLYIYIYI